MRLNPIFGMKPALSLSLSGYEKFHVALVQAAGSAGLVAASLAADEFGRAAGVFLLFR